MRKKSGRDKNTSPFHLIFLSASSSFLLFFSRQVERRGREGENRTSPSPPYSPIFLPSFFFPPFFFLNMQSKREGGKRGASGESGRFMVVETEGEERKR